MSIGRRIWISKTLTICALIVFTGLALWTAQSANTATAARRQATQVLLDTQAVLAGLRDAETGQRGFLLTGDERYLEPFDAAADTACELRIFKAAGLGEPPALGPLVAQLSGICREKIAELHETVRLRRQQGLAAALALVTTDRGKVLMDRARVIAAQMQGIEAAEIGRQDADVSREQNLLLIALGGGSLGLTALILINGRYLVRSLRRPVATIEAGIRRIADGDLGVEVAIVGNNELSGLARAYNAMTGELRAERANRERAEAQAATAASSLRARSEELERRTRAIGLVGEMANRLLASGDEREFVEVVELYAPQLLPKTRGALYSISNSRTHVRRIGAWGDAAGSAPDFAPEDCWAIRRGRPHVVGSLSSDIVCRHVEPGSAANYRCMPLVAQGETVGLLHIEEDTAESALGEHERQILNETIAGSLVNIRLRDSLRNQSIRDPLTGLFNRRYLDESFELEFARVKRSGQPLGVIMADVDHFKRFNDSFGHEAGDAVLKQFAEILRRSARSGDIICRFGGEEFVMVLPGSESAVARQVADRIRRDVAACEFTQNGRGLGKVTVSLGIADYPAAGRSPAALMAAADQALYAAKAAGRNQVETFGRSRLREPLAAPA
jgi:diguanylate cyclase (GGDEF)-like protein